MKALYRFVLAGYLVGMISVVVAEFGEEVVVAIGSTQSLVLRFLCYN